MKHEDVASLLPDLHRGELEGAARREVETHLGSCEKCAALDLTYRTLNAAIKASAQSPDHPSVDEIVLYAVRRDRLNDETVRRISTHVDGCRTCAEELRRTDLADASAVQFRATGGVGRSRSAARAPRGIRILALAAAILLAVLLYPAFLGIFRFPELRQRVDSLTATTARLESEARDLGQSLESVRTMPDRLQEWSGALQLNLLSSTLREAGARPRVTVVDDQPFVAFGVEIDLPQKIPADASVFFRFTDEHGEIAAEIELSAAEAQHAIRSAGVVTVLVPSKRLPDGSYRFEVIRADVPDAGRILRVEFDVARIDAP